MHSRSNQTGFNRCFGNRFANLSHATTEDEIKQTYDDWSGDYDKVTSTVSF